MVQNRALDELVTRLEPTLPRTVDSLHMAAELESRGISDRMAVDRYGHDDVFALAETMSARLPDAPERPADELPARRKPASRSLTILAHGPLYGLLSFVYPAVFIWLGGRVMLWGLVLATGFGWVWGMGLSTAAQRLRDENRYRAAAQLIQQLMAAGVALALVAGTVLALVGPGGPAMVAFVVCQVAFQLGTGILVIYGRERRLIIAMLPAIGAGATHLGLGFAPGSVIPVLVAGAMSCAALVGVAVYTVSEAAAEPDPPGGPARRRLAIIVLPGIGYAAICASFLLFTDARFLTARFDLSIGVVPLVLGMGALELRSYRFTGQATELLRGVRMPDYFGRDVWRLLLHELTICVLVLGTLGIALLAVLAGYGTLTARGALLVDAHIVLGCALFVGFVLANLGLFRPLLAVTAAVVAADVVATVLLSRFLAPHGEVPIFFTSCIALLLLLLAVLKKNIGVVYHYRT